MTTNGPVNFSSQDAALLAGLDRMAKRGVTGHERLLTGQQRDMMLFYHQPKSKKHDTGLGHAHLAPCMHLHMHFRQQDLHDVGLEYDSVLDVAHRGCGAQ